MRVAWLVSAGEVLTGPAGGRIRDGAVLVVGNEIAAVGGRQDMEALAPAGALRAEFPEGCLLPGLIDSHVHLAFDGGPDPRAALQDVSDADLALGMAGRARELLASGVTTVRDLGDLRRLTVALRQATADGRVPGPRILSATTPLTSPGGHCGFLGGEVASDAAIRELVQANAAAGADVIKVMASGGHLTPSGPAMWESQFTAAQLGLITGEAHACGLPVAAHAHGTDAITAAVNAGVDTIEHCTWLHGIGFEVPAATVSQIIDKKISVCPAISRNWRDFGKRFGEHLAEEFLLRLRWLDEQGVRLAAGTDAGIPGASFTGYVDGLEAFLHAGMTPERIIEIATVDSAAALRLAGTTGQIAAGFSADLLVVDGSPLDDLGALRAVRMVFAQGRPYGRFPELTPDLTGAIGSLPVRGR